MSTIVLCLFVFGAAALAYEMIYPVVVQSSMGRLMIADLVLTLSTLAVVGTRFWESGHAFSFGLFETNWFVATLLALFAAEAVLVPRYCRRFGIDLFKQD